MSFRVCFIARTYKVRKLARQRVTRHRRRRARLAALAARPMAEDVPLDPDPDRLAWSDVPKSLSCGGDHGLCAYTGCVSRPFPGTPRIGVVVLYDVATPGST